MKKKTIVILICTVAVLICSSVLYFTLFKTPPEPKFQGFFDASIRTADFDEVIEMSKRLVELQIIRELDIKEAAEKVGDIQSILLERSTFYEAKILREFNSESFDVKKEVETIIFAQFGTHEWQRMYNPLYKVGDKYVVFLSKNYETDKYWGPYNGATSVFDVIETGGETYLYKRSGTVIKDNAAYMSEEESTRITTNPENPTKYEDKITLEDLLSETKKLGFRTYDKTTQDDDISIQEAGDLNDEE